MSTWTSEPSVTAFATSAAAAVVTCVGVFAVRRQNRWAEECGIYFVSFAAGSLITACFLHLVPRSFAMTARGPAYLLGGFLALLLLNRAVVAHACEREKAAHAALGVTALVGIGFHSLMDGVVYAVTFHVSAFTGAIAAVGMVLHEFPEGVITYVLLLRSGFDRPVALRLALAAAAASTPIGTLVSLPFVGHLGPQRLGALLALSGGALVYVGAAHLLPQTEQEPRKYSLAALAGGVLVSVAIVVSEPS